MSSNSHSMAAANKSRHLVKGGWGGGTNNYTVSLNHPAFVNKCDVTSHDSFKARFWKVGQYHMRKRDWKCICLRSSAQSVLRWRSESEEMPAEKITKIGGR